MFTIEQAKEWVNERREELVEGFLSCEKIPKFFRKPGCKMEDVWCSGCWMNEKLRESGATEEDVHRIGFCHGQRSFFGDPYEWAVRYVNEFIESKAIQDQPGEELADQICKEEMGI